MSITPIQPSNISVNEKADKVIVHAQGRNSSVTFNIKNENLAAYSLGFKDLAEMWSHVKENSIKYEFYKGTYGTPVQGSLEAGRLRYVRIDTTFLRITTKYKDSDSIFTKNEALDLIVSKYIAAGKPLILVEQTGKPESKEDDSAPKT